MHCSGALNWWSVVYSICGTGVLIRFEPLGVGRLDSSSGGPAAFGF